MQPARIRIDSRAARARALVLAGFATALAGAVSGAAQAADGGLVLASRASGNGAAGNGNSRFASISADGRLVAFRSEATNLHPDDTDAERDVYVRDLHTGATILVSRASGAAGEKGDRASYNPRISADGRYVAFRSYSTNLHPDDPDDVGDVFVRDLRTNETTLVSRGDTVVGTKGNGGSFNPSISGDGARVAFRSEATNIDSEDPDATRDVFVRDLRTHQTTLVSRASGAGAKGSGPSSFPVISADGRRVVFRSEAPNLHPDDTDAGRDVFVRDLETGETILVSRAAGAGGAKGNNASMFAALSADGSLVAFDSHATNLHPEDRNRAADVFLRNLQTQELVLVSRAPGAAGAQGNGSSFEPTMSADGRVIAFHSVATNFDPADRDTNLDAYARDLATQRTVLVSAPSAQGRDGASSEPWVAAGGGVVAFHSNADDLHPDDLDSTLDVFARTLPRLPRCFGEQATAFAAAGGVTRGGGARDVIVGTRGDDRIRSGGGADLICAGRGTDFVAGGRGPERIAAGGGGDVVRAGRGRDRVAGRGGQDRLTGGRGGDRLKGHGKPDRLGGGPGADRLDGGAGRDRLAGGRARDRCRGGGGRDREAGCER